MHVLASRRAEVSILDHGDGTPSGLMLIRCGSLREIAKVGFVDLKEQALPAIAKRHRVEVERRPACLMTVRTARDYLTALRYDHKRQQGEAIEQHAFAEDWQAEFSVVEKDANVGAGARLFDSVVLAGGEVGAGAVLVRSVVCPGASVRANQRIVDEVVTVGGSGSRGGGL